MQCTEKERLEAFCLHLAENERAPATIEKYRKETLEFLPKAWCSNTARTCRGGTGRKR